ncbi:hypothetical protein Tsubulata_004209 [Turnera subulata]|uniref:Glutaredoxin domain-containing protein n=1 Tax=Turnera subulata TaxID=218843 RepID=A0A9Q0FTF9_9ROSI|nr:hypothetical protein Tsubulata_004209 [Turnera subulata]
MRKGDSHHLVSLTSSTYGSLLLLHPRSPPHTSSSSPAAAADHPGDSLSPDSVINTWELMDGLDDDLDFENSNKAPTFPAKEGSFRDLGSGYFDSEEIVAEAKPVSSSKPLWKHLSEEAFLSKMDPDVVSSYMRALSSRQLGCNRKEPSFTRSVDSSPAATTTTTPIGLASNVKEDNKIVVYFTSLRGIRKTYEDCCAVRMILRGFRVLVDERDISMDSAYRKELQGLLKGKAMSLPQVFIREKHIGGVDEIRQLNEAGELGKLLGGIPVRDHPGLVCESCGDARFVPCPNCSGSRKVFDVDEEQLRRCPDCNENGLIRCPGCCSS